MSTTTSTLNSLIETLKDGQEGFRVAAEDIDSPELKNLFTSYSMERATFAGELQSQARSLGEDNPTDSGSVAGALHRGWINLASAMATKDTHAILAECERGEDSAVAEYRKALEDTALPAPVRGVVQEQFSKVQAAHDRVRDLRDSYAPKG